MHINDPFLCNNLGATYCFDDIFPAPTLFRISLWILTLELIYENIKHTHTHTHYIIL